MRAKTLQRSAAALMVLTFSLQHAVAQTAPFSDMEHSWFGYQDAVSYLVQKGSIEGYPDGTFKPKQTVNRAEFLKLVFASRSSTQPSGSDCFEDVKADDWFAPFVCAAKRRGIVNGYRVGTRYIFKPEEPIVFAEAVKMILLAYGENINEATGEQWYAPYVDTLDRNNVLRKTSYIPWEELTRERAADLIARYVRKEEDRVDAHLSPGCGRAERQASTTLSVNGQSRSYLLTKPRNYVSHDPSPLIVAFHGRTNPNDRVRGYYGLDKNATDYFIAYPAAISNGNGSFSWSDPGDKASEIRDYAFFDAIVRELGETYCIDMDRIFVVGHSLGAWMANSVACARGGVVRGSATVGGSTTMSNCTGPTAALIINNPKDASSPHSASEAMRDIRVQQNTCEYRTAPVAPSTFSCAQFASCTDNPVTFCPHTIDREKNGAYYPHTWPDGTGQAIVAFFDALD